MSVLEADKQLVEESIPQESTMPIPELKDVQHVFESPENALAYLAEKGFQFVHEYCLRCGAQSLWLHKGRKHKDQYYRCRRRNCRYEFSMFKCTFFEYSRIYISKILEIAYYWLRGDDVQIIALTCAVNKNTVLKWTHALRDLIVWDVQGTFGLQPIGGQNVVAEIDESMCAYDRCTNESDRPVKGAWVICGVDRSVEKGRFSVVIEGRSASRLWAVLRSHVSPGSVIYTDSWKRFDSAELATVGMYRDEHTGAIGFIDHSTGGASNLVERRWEGISVRVCRHHRTRGFVQGDLMVHVWKRQYNDHWERLLAALCRVVCGSDDDTDGDMVVIDESPPIS